MSRRLSPAAWVWLLRLSRPSEDAATRPGRALALAALGVLLASVALAFGGIYTYLTHDLPPVEDLARFLAPRQGLFWQPTRLYAADGRLWWPPPDQTAPASYLPLGQTPPAVVQTTLAALDPTFWDHAGSVGPWWRTNAPRTLAQRLVARFLLADRTHDPRTAWQERLLARQATARYGQGQVLEWFLNSAAYGPGVYGITAAAHTYFAKEPQDLTWAEAAWLAVAARAFPQDPWQVADDLQQQAAALLADLAAAGVAPTADVTVNLQPQPTTDAPPAVRAVFQALERTLPAWPAVERGLAVDMDLDPNLMQQAACLSRAVATLTAPEGCPDPTAVPLYRLARPLPQVAFHLVALDPETGAVLAWFTTPPQAQATLPVGSLVAPWVYAVAFSRGWGPATLMWDLPDSVPLGLRVTNHDGRFHGPLRARRALANAYEVPLAALLDRLDPRTVWPTVRRLGLGGWPAAVVWEPLEGRVALSPVQVAHGLSPFATLGAQSGLPQPYAADLLPRWWSRVRTADGRSLPTTPVPARRAVLDPALAYLVTDVLADGPAHRPTLAPGDPLAGVEPAAVALGRSPQGRVQWVAVWSPARIALVAVDGRDSPSDPRDLRAAAHVLAAAWWRAVQSDPPPSWSRPPQVVEVPVCDPSGLLPTADCPNVVVERFLQDRVPAQVDPYYRRLPIDRRSGLLATVFTPPQDIEERVFFLWPPEARTWAQEQGLPVPPQAYAPIRPPQPDPNLHFTRPAMFAYVKGQVRLEGVVAGPEVRSYRIQVGQGPFPRRWLTVAQGEAPVQGLLGVWDTTGLRGLYTVQLMALDANDRVRTATLQVSVDPQPPRVSVRWPQDGGRYCPVLPCDEADAPSLDAALPIEVRAEDDVALAEVRAWLNGVPLARWAQPPFTLAWSPTPGRHTLRVEARDRAGNRAQATITFTVEEGP